MEKADFKKIRELIARLEELDRLFAQMPVTAGKLEEEAAKACRDRQEMQASVRLRDIPVDELKKSRAGIRTGILLDAGYRTLYDLYTAGSSRLCDLQGIGEKQAGSIRMIMAEFLSHYAKRERIRFSGSDEDPSERALIQALAKCRTAGMVNRDAQALAGDLHTFLTDTIGRIRIRNSARWFFSFRKTKEETLLAVETLRAFCRSEQFDRAERLVRLFTDAEDLDEKQALEDYEKNSAAYYALIDKLTDPEDVPRALYGSVPAALASKICEEEVDLREFHGDLRSYQKFGVQYVLHQKKVLLGDEMGLGKSVQAIAVMVHLSAGREDGRFLVVCPASVMLNWCREIEKFSRIRALLLHGQRLEGNFREWQEKGGAAVTNYESMPHIIDRIDSKMRIALLVIDEAHYIKNPEARRTKYIRRLEDESDYILMMTGTPMENRVHEMCELVEFVRPDLAKKVRELAAMHRIPAFREILAPVYLRRQTEQVLDELPALTEMEEWCSMTSEDLAYYVKELPEGNFMALRRVSFLQDDMAKSAKALRLRELCVQAGEEERKIIVFSYFRETVQRCAGVLQDVCIGEITGSTSIQERQEILDRFAGAGAGSVLICQIQAGGTGINIQTASVVIFCEPQIKPSLERQAIARVYRMGQIRSVLVYRLLCSDTMDETIMQILETKQKEFDLYADESVMAEAEASLADREWIRSAVEEERRKYLPALIDPK